MVAKCYHLEKNILKLFKKVLDHVQMLRRQRMDKFAIKLGQIIHEIIEKCMKNLI